MPVEETSGRATYNGVRFEIYSSQISGTPVEDDAERTVIGVKWVLSFHAYVVADAGETTDTTLTTLRQRLTAQAKPLTYSSKGFGGLKVNQGEVWDMKWGPKPTLMTFVPIGDSQAAIVDWKVETVIPECRGARYQFGIAAINFKVAMTIDADGYMVLNHSGYIEIPMTRQTSEARGLVDHVRKYMEDATPPSILGFQRTNQRTDESLDKRRLDFEFSDVQLPTPLFPYTTKADLTQTLKTGLRNRGYNIFDGNISGSITVPANINKQITYTLFLALLHQRIINLRNAPPSGGGGGGTGIASVLNPLIQAIQGLMGPVSNALKAWVWVTEFSVKDNITGRNTDYSADYRIILTGRPHQVGDVFLKNAFWHPLANTDWEIWKVSMDETANRPRGSRNYRDEGKTDAIVDLCLGGRERGAVPALSLTGEPARMDRPLRMSADATGSRGEPSGKVSAFMPRDRPGADVSKPNPENSWVYYDCSIHYLEEEPGRYARHKPMGGQTRELSAQVVDAVGNAETIQRQQASTVGSAYSNLPDNLHEVRSPSVAIRLRGQAIRLGYQITPPKLVSVGGVSAKFNRVIEHREVTLSQYAGIPVIGTAWDLEYLLEEVPQGKLPTIANPQLHTV